MISLVRRIAASLPLIALPALAAEHDPATGITTVGPAAFIFTIAGALLLTLVFRDTSSHLLALASRWLGTKRIRRTLEKCGPSVLHDFILPGAYGGLTKIDHAVLTAGGLLCIQAKHHHGIIFGTEDDAQWTHVDGRRKKRFLNPLIQNEGRARALRNIIPDVPVASLVVFTGKVEFSTSPPQNVIHVSALKRYVDAFAARPSRVEDWESVWMTLNAAALTDEDTRKDLQAQIA